MMRRIWTAMTCPMLTVIIVGCFLALCGLASTSNVEVAERLKSCKSSFSVRSDRRVDICHNITKARDKGPYSCSQSSKGVVLLRSVVLAPLSFYKDCGSFHSAHLYDAQCVSEKMPEEDVYKRIMYELLEKVSGKNTIPSATVVDRFPLAVVNKEGEETEDFSAFVSFKLLCKSVYPESTTDMINMCSNKTLNGTFMFFTLRGTVDIPDTPSMCRCVLRPTTNLKLLALDVRLQNASNRHCGRSTLKIQSNESTTPSVTRCEKMTALYGNEEMYSSDKPQEVTLTLTHVSKDNFPSSMWINAQDTFRKGGIMSVSCEGFLPMPTEVPDGGDSSDGDDNGDGEDEGDSDGGGDNGDGDLQTPSAGPNIILIVVAVIGGLLVVVILIFIIIKRRRSGSYSGIVPPCCRCLQEQDDDDPIFYKPVAQQEPVYAEPGKPRPSTTTPPYIFPADAKLPDGRAVYAEPDPNGTLGLRAHSTTPPPIPESPPPSTVPPAFPPGTPPPKPERTLLRPRKESASSGTAVEEDYDHIVAGGKTPLKTPRGRDGQNNIIGDREEGGMDSARGNNIYDCLQHGDDYSQIGEVPKQQVKDNLYDTTE